MARSNFSPCHKVRSSSEVHVRTGLNVRHADEQLRGTIALPNGLDHHIASYAVWRAGATPLGSHLSHTAFMP